MKLASTISTKDRLTTTWHSLRVVCLPSSQPIQDWMVDYTDTGASTTRTGMRTVAGTKSSLAKW